MSWLELWAIARYDLALAPEDFFGMTMRQFQALLDRHNLRRQAADYRAGELCALVANGLSGGKGRRFKPSDFFPSLRALDRPQTSQEQLAILQFIAGKQNSRLEN